MDSVHQKVLRIPLYDLYYIKDLAAVGTQSDSELKNVYANIDSAMASKMMNALDWAVENPDFDYSSLLPNLKPTNDEIYDYLVKVRKLCQRKWGVY